MITKEKIIERMQSAIPNNYDKSEGSFIYDAIVAVATALEDFYIEKEVISDKAFIDNLSDDELDKKVGEQGVIRRPATRSTTNLLVTGINGKVIPKGTRFFADDVYFVSTETKAIIDESTYIKVECEVEGTKGNVPANSIVNFEPIDGIISVTNPNVVVNGLNAESDESLKEQYYNIVRRPAASGNVQDYIKWCKEVIGIADAKIFPLWNGNGTVKCVVINSNKRAADASLINLVKENIEKKRPIGAKVTVESAVELPINISVDINLESGYDINIVRNSIISALNNHFQEFAFKRDYVSVALIGSAILEVSGVNDYISLTVNGGTSNIAIGSSQIAVVGEVNVT